MGGRILILGLMHDGSDGWEDFLIAPCFRSVGIDVFSENLALKSDKVNWSRRLARAALACHDDRS